jgi:3-methyladenine DNA glycosylase AlkD
LLKKENIMATEISAHTVSILKDYSPSDPQATADALQAYWLTFETNQGINLVKAEQRAQIGAVGTPVPVLKDMGSVIAKAASKDVDKFLPLAHLLWDRYGREGRIVALIVFGAMELADPQRLVPILKELCRSCVSWEDADRLSMDALEPIVRKFPAPWIGEMAAWLNDENKWVRRAAVTVILRLPMKHPELSEQCLQLAGSLICDADMDVKRAVSFAIRMIAKIDPELVLAFIEKQLARPDPDATWVLCDVIKSLDRKLLGKFSVLLPLFQNWRAMPTISDKNRRSIDSAIKVLSMAS